MGEYNIKDVEKMKKHIRRVRTQKISSMMLTIIIIISIAIICTCTYLHQKWHEETTSRISDAGVYFAEQISTLAKPAEWKLRASKVDFREDKEVAVNGVSQYEIIITEPANGKIIVEGTYDKEENVWYNDRITSYVYMEKEPTIVEISYLFSAILAVYYSVDSNDSYNSIYRALNSIYNYDYSGHNLIFGKAGNIFVDVGQTDTEANAAWFLDAGSYN